jgi:hypothetical protein
MAMGHLLELRAVLVPADDNAWQHCAGRPARAQAVFALGFRQLVLTV